MQTAKNLPGTDLSGETLRGGFCVDTIEHPNPGFFIMTYQEQLEDPRWKARRDEILQLDSYKCQYCKTDRNLNVHHLYYVRGRMAWEYPDNALITLCISCHEIAHERIKAAKSNKRRMRNKEGEYETKHISEVFTEIFKKFRNA